MKRFSQLGGDMKSYFEGVIGGLCSGLFLLAVYAVANVVIVGTEPANWLDFAGVVFGIILTVTGTLFIQHRADRRRDKQAADIMLELANQWDEIVKAYLSNGDERGVQRLLNLVSQIEYFIEDFDKSDPRKWLEICELRTQGLSLISSVQQYWAKQMDQGNPSAHETIMSVLSDWELPRYSAKIRQVFGGR